MEHATVDPLIDSVRQTVISWRRHLHQHPEPSFQEENTSRFVQEHLNALGNLEVSRPTKTSVLGCLKGGKPGKTVALRADIDALPIQEETGCEFASLTPGLMHACGHDAHTAMLLGTATVLSRLQPQLQGEVRFLFQHAEETQPGGARQILETDALQGVDRILGLHVMSHIPVGQFGLLYGPAMAAADTIDILIEGKGGHSSQPHLVVDPIAIGAQVITNLQHIVSRNLNPMDKLVISITTVHGGTVYNITPDTMKLQGSIRSFTHEARSLAAELTGRISRGIVAAHGATCKIEYFYGYDPVYNDPEVTKTVEETIVELWGKEALFRMDPLMGSEDFSFYLKQIPGCFVFVGAANPEKFEIQPLHNSRMVIDEGAMDYGVRLTVHAALKLLSQP